MSPVVRCFGGVLLAFLLFEVALRPFVAGPNLSDGNRRTIRNYFEGLADAHFEADEFGTFGNRLTGNPPAGTSEGIILGDSHVIAQAVRDEETMGAIIERLSRQSGHPLNVRQYGWTSANSPTFLAVAEPLLKKHNPAWVVVVLNSFNIGVNALTTTENWRMELGPGDSARLIDMRATPKAARERLRREIGRSALLLAIWRRLGLLNRRTADASADASEHHPELAQAAARVPRATVAGLKRAYGWRLIIVYVPYFPGTHYDLADPQDQEVLALCAEYGLPCLSMREALARDRYSRDRLSRGFQNTAPGEGHLNAIGHQIIAEEIWRYLSRSPFTS